MKEETTDSIHASTVGAPATFKVPSPQTARRTDDIPMGYSRQAALKMEQCDMTT
jgi:hypothetical protein